MRRRFMNIGNSAPLSFEALEDGLSISFSNEILYRINGGTWKTLLAGETTEEVNKGSVISFQHAKSIISDGSIGQFSINKKCNVFGACSSIIPKVFGEKYMARQLFYNLFYGCDTIVDASKLELPATTLTERCYSNMFLGCTSLTTAPALPATTLAESCYQQMFYGCTNLTVAPELPATTLADSCYYSMFDGCTSLTTAPELPATTLVDQCYKYMFYYCQSLTTAPELPATTLADSCYYRMFYGCTKLNYIKMLATDISASNCLLAWVYRVASTGTFVKHPDMTTLPTGSDGIPSGWTVVNDGEESGSNDGPVTFSIQSYDGVTEHTIPYQMTWQEFVDSEYNKIWYEHPYGRVYEFVIDDDRVKYKEYPVHDGDYVYEMSSDKIKEVRYYAD